MAGGYVYAAEGFAHSDGVADSRRGRIVVAEQSGKTVAFQYFGDSEGKVAAHKAGIMAEDYHWLARGDRRGFFAPLRLQIIGNALGGQADTVKSEVARNETTPTGRAKLDGGQRIAHVRLTFPVEGILLHSINVADQENAKEGDHGSKDEVGIYCLKHILVDDGPREKKDHLNVKEDEQHRHEIKFHGHAAGAFSFGGHAAFVRGILGGVARGAFTDQLRNDEISASKYNGDTQQN